MESGEAAAVLRMQTESDVDMLQAETAAEDNLLDVFYAAMYERAVLVGTGGSLSPSKDNSADASDSGGGGASPPRRGAGSPRKHMVAGPTATSLSAANTSQPTLGAPSPLLTREIMNALLPPKTWSDAAGTWQRMVKLTLAPRSDVVQLEDALDRLLVNRQARATAICHVREKLFLQVFETLIRDAACECPERGLLLLRMRDELRLTIAAAQTLYHNSIAFGRTKAVQAESGIVELEANVQRLEREREQLAATKSALLLAERLQAERVAEQTRKLRARQMQERRFLQTQQIELETFVRELEQDTAWK